MGRKKQGGGGGGQQAGSSTVASGMIGGKPALKQFKPFCYYCDREFVDEKELIQHQKMKHFRCNSCSKRLDSAHGLAFHMMQVHRETLTTVPHSLPGRGDPDIVILGMEGVPYEVLKEKAMGTTREAEFVDAPPPSAPVGAFPGVFPGYMARPAAMPMLGGSSSFMYGIPPMPGGFPRPAPAYPGAMNPVGQQPFVPTTGATAPLPSLPTPPGFPGMPSAPTAPTPPTFPAAVPPTFPGATPAAAAASHGPAPSKSTAAFQAPTTPYGGPSSQAAANTGNKNGITGLSAAAATHSSGEKSGIPLETDFEISPEERRAQMDKYKATSVVAA